MDRFLGKIIKSRQPSTLPPAAAATPPGGGEGYPVAFTGDRLQVDSELLKRCKALAPRSGAYQLNESIVLKTGDAVSMAEAAAMRLVAEKTSIPVPLVIDAYVQDADGSSVILMDYVDGERLDIAWPKLDPKQQQALIAQLRRYMDELRKIDGNTIGAVDGTRCNDRFFNDGTCHFGPYVSEADFNQGLIRALEGHGKSTRQHLVSRFVAALDSHKTVLTHNDLAARNILIRGDNIVAILGWEQAGFYPDYWEYIKAYLWADWESFWIIERIPDQVLEPKLQQLSCMLHARDLLR